MKVFIVLKVSQVLQDVFGRPRTSQGWFEDVVRRPRTGQFNFKIPRTIQVSEEFVELWKIFRDYILQIFLEVPVISVVVLKIPLCS